MLSGRILLIMAQAWLVLGAISLVYAGVRLFARALAAGMAVGHLYWIIPAAIAAGGFLNLASFTQDPIRARLYQDYALKILDTLTEPEFLAIDTPGWEGILKHGEYHRDKGLGVDESVMWGEHFFVEAVDKALALRG